MRTKVLARVETVLRYIMTAISVALVSIVFLQVFLRYVMSSGFSWAEELSRYLFLWLMFLGISLGVQKKTHIAVTMLTDWLKIGKRFFPVVRSLFNLIFFVFLTWTGVELMESGRGMHSSLLRIEMYWIYAIVPLSGLFSLVFLVLDLLPGGGEEAPKEGEA